MTPWQVPQIVITSKPSCSAWANVRALSANATSGFTSLTTPAPQQEEAANSTTSIPIRPMIAIVDWYSSGVAPFAAHPGYNAYLIDIHTSRYGIGSFSPF